VTEGKLTGICGLCCAECPAFVGTRTGDEDLLAATAAKWTSDDYPLTAADIRCDGCTFVDKRVAKFCPDCSVRRCGLERDVANCAHCGDFACAELERKWEASADGKATLEAIRAKLKPS